MKKAFLYLRVSTAGQTDKDGFPRQEEACRAFVAKQGWEVARVFKETQSGSDDYSSRKVLAEALELASAGSATGVDSIVVERSDRIARDLFVSEVFLRACKDRGVKVYAADSGDEIVGDENPTRTLIRHVLAAVAQFDKSSIVQKMQSGRRAKAERTKMPCGGPPPSPYGDRGGIAQKNQERLVIKHILSMRGEGHSFNYIAERLRNCRIQNPHPNLGRGNKHASFFWGRKTVERIFKLWSDRTI